MRDAIVTANKISVRKGRGQNFEQLGTYKNGDKIIVLDSALGEDYAMVLWKAGYAYSNKGQYIQFIDPQSPDLTGDTPNAKVTANVIAVREGRSSGFPALGEYKKEDSALDQDYAKVLWEAGYAYSSSGKYIQFVSSAPDEPNAVVTANRISVRTGRGLNYAKLGEFVKGDEIVVLDDTLDYSYVRVVWNGGDGYAYCDFGKYIEFTVEQQTGDICCRDMEPNAVVTANRISVREGRGVNFKKLGEFKKGDNIVVGDKTLDHEYVMVKWDSTIAYAYCDYGMYIHSTDKPLCDCINSTLDIAKTCVGGKYIYGAQGAKITESYVKKRKSTHPEYFTGGRYEFLLDIGKRCDASGIWKFPDDYAWDCSGLWWYCADKANIYGRNLDTTANTFYHSYCTPVKKAELRPGDAVFYMNSSGRVTHMAFVGEGGVVYEAMSGYTGVVEGSSVDDRTAPKIVGSGNLKRSPWNTFGRPKIFLDV
jgi:sortase (surface protein transpeptidase)